MAKDQEMFDAGFDKGVKFGFETASVKMEASYLARISVLQAALSVAAAAMHNDTSPKGKADYSVVRDAMEEPKESPTPKPEGR